ncbi:G patch domain-containing protein 1 [Leucoagaricus sp. SymC.cos]|nr:G patch domain-containing protein 1 [Leucoagaricus sp. SymC.cos]
MSNRLKRKLNDLGVDVASSKVNESFCLVRPRPELITVKIGTPLPPLEKSKDLGEFVPLWKQEVRDEKGRRRLHGAFTGGFSAGYFNTVGSKEGWTPSTFVSSRGDRAKSKASRPEDFMDEEDLQELRESRTIVDTTQEMDLTAGTSAELAKRQVTDDSEQDTLVYALQSTLLPPPTDSVGARILKKMGWRLGNGLGPRISLRQRRLQDLQASSPHGTRAVIDDIKITEDDEEANKHTYAPRDTPVLVVERKDNAHGIDYRPGMTLHESMGSSKQGSITGPRISAGFGLGALNDADEDDLDVYDADFKTTRNRQAYDAQHADDIFTLGDKANALTLDKRSTTSGSATFRDGSRVLSGFGLSEKPVMEDRWFPFPDILPGWKPNPVRVWEENKENIAKPGARQEPVPHEKWKTSTMTAGESVISPIVLTSLRRKREKYQQYNDDEEGMWVEKPPPDVVKSLLSPPHTKSTEHGPASDVRASTTEASIPSETDSGIYKGRKRAIDFL